MNRVTWNWRRARALSLFAVALAWTSAAQAVVANKVKGFSLTEIGHHVYDAFEDPSLRSEAQYIVDRLYHSGVRHINLSPRAVMRDPRQSHVELMTPPAELQYERERYGRLIRYIKSKGMTVGIRPIFFVIDSNGNIPYVEPLAGGGEKVWWHGNIQPADPVAWMGSFRNYLAHYMAIANDSRVEEFTIGAELQSMTIGIGNEWPMYPQGFPRQWRELLEFARATLYNGCRILYDINYTDDAVQTVAGTEWGGELIEWRKALVDAIANGAAPTDRWHDLAAFWRGLDAVGIDMYRSLADTDAVIPTDYNELVALLRKNTDAFASQLDGIVRAVGETVGLRQDVILKELGYRSVERGFIDPFTYAGPGLFNAAHQAAAYEAVLSSFTTVGAEWFKGVVLWDASVDLDRHGPFDPGFSPIGKELSESVLMRFFGSWQ